MVTTAPPHPAIVVLPSLNATVPVGTVPGGTDVTIAVRTTVSVTAAMLAGVAWIVVLDPTPMPIVVEAVCPSTVELTLAVPTELKNVPPLIVLILVLLIRPQGIFGSKQRVG